MSFKKIDKNLRLAGIVAFIAIVSVVGTVTLRGSFASPLVKQPIQVSVRSVLTYPIDQATQLQRISVTLNIVNNETTDLQISPGLQMQMIDNTGQAESMTAQYLPAGQIVGGPLAPGASWDQAIDFNMPAGRIPSEIVFQQDDVSAPIKVGL